MYLANSPAAAEGKADVDRNALALLIVLVIAAFVLAYRA